MSKIREKVRTPAILAVALLPFLLSFVGASRGDRTVQQGLKPPSELALLMREMTAFTDSVRHRLQRGDELPPYPAGFAAIQTATPTDGKLEIERATFDAFADHYLAQVKALYDAPPADRISTFNATVQGCANCHAVACPGPLLRINKLFATSGAGPKE